MLTTARVSPVEPKAAAWKAGINGAPSPPAARSRRRKSATTSMPSRSAMMLGSPICKVNGASPCGRCRTVWPWLPMARTALAGTCVALSNCSAACANSRATVVSSRPNSVRPMWSESSAARRSRDLLVDLSGIDELTEIKSDGRGVTIGAGVTIATLARNTAIASQYRALAPAAEAIAGPGHRVMATVGGNLCLDTRCIYYNQSEWWRSANAYCLKNRGDVCHVAPQGQRCHAAFSGDLAPALLVLGAEIDIACVKGQRRISLSELYFEDGNAHLALAAGELIVAVHLPAAPPPSAYEKVRVRGAIDFPLAGVAVALAASGTNVGSLRIALTGTNSRPFLLAGTEAFV